MLVAFIGGPRNSHSTEATTGYTDHFATDSAAQTAALLADLRVGNAEGLSDLLGGARSLGVQSDLST